MLVVLAAGGVLLGACSSGATSASRSTTTSTSARSTTTTTSTGRSTTTTTSSGASTTTSTTGGPGVAMCLATQLSIAPHQGGGAAGTISLTVSMKNTSSTTCTLQGYPGMQLLGAQGTPIPTTVVRGGLAGSSGAAAQQPSLVTLSPGQVAAFALQYEDVPVGNETTCPTSAKAEITPPNDTAPALVPLVIAPCNGGTVHVSPVYAAS
jgi:hypothetical protein